jgi:hypothetical protein
MTEVIQMNTDGEDLGHIAVQPEFDEPERESVGVVAAPVAPINDPVVKNTVINNIRRWKASRLGRKMQHISIDGLENMAVDDLNLLLAEIKQAGSGTNTTSMAETGFIASMHGIESFACAKTPAKLQGFAAAVCNDDTLDIVAEIAIENNVLCNAG